VFSIVLGKGRSRWSELVTRGSWGGPSGGHTVNQAGARIMTTLGYRERCFMMLAHSTGADAEPRREGA
jgi:hypothetical protein